MIPWHGIFSTLTNEMLGVYDLNGRILRINHRWTEVLGWDEEKFLSTPIRFFIHPKDIVIPETLFKTIAPDTISENYEGRWLCKDGSYRVLSWNFVFSSADQLFYAVGRDVTVLKRDFYLLQQTQRIAHIGGWVFNGRRGDLFWTEETYRLHGVDPKTFDLTLENVKQLYTEESQSRMALAREALQKFNKESFNVELEIIQPSGKRVLVASHYEPLFEDGELVGSKGTVRDITELRGTQRKLWEINQLNTAVINSSTYAIIAVDTNDTVTLFNPAASEMFGYSFEEMRQKDRPHILDRQELAERQKAFEQKHNVSFATHFEYLVALSEYDRDHQSQWPAYTKEGKKIYCDMSMTVLRDTDQKAVGYVAIMKDITLEKQYKEELIKTREQALIATKAKSEFLANMSHEIRTPMNSVMGMAELLLETQVTEEQQQYLSILDRAAKSLLDIINDILDLSKIEAGHISIQYIPFSLQEVLDKAMEIFLHKAKEKNIKLQSHIMGSPHQLGILGDPTRLRQILINLIGNAIKFTEKGGTVIIMTVIKPEEIEISVRDTGVGMTPEQKLKLFDRFSQGDSSITRRYGGTGLGLYISKLLVERMNGKISVESEIGQGSTFKISFPHIHA
ncbi:Signal transduction histidine-protein kinase BarA [compost metagenome]